MSARRLQNPRVGMILAENIGRLGVTVIFGMAMFATVQVVPSAPPKTPLPVAFVARPAPTPMSSEVAVGQMFAVGFSGTEITPELRHLIVDDKVGTIVLFSNNFGGSASGLRNMVAQLDQIGAEADLPAPLLITLDQEGGEVARVNSGIPTLPSEQALGQGGVGATEQAVEQMSQGLRACGVGLDLAPVVDLRTNPADQVIGDRSFGGDAGSVGLLDAAYVRGLQAGGVGATIKHFPGLGGAAGDPHVAVPTDGVSLDQWMQTSAQSFAAGIQAGADAVMTTAVYVPGLDATNTLAMFSQPVVTGLLRDRLGFGGVIVTDSLSLGGLSLVEPLPREAVDAVKAGNDLLLMNSDPADEEQAVLAVQAAVASGEIPLAQVRASAARVVALRHRYAQPAPAVLSATKGPQ